VPVLVVVLHASRQLDRTALAQLFDQRLARFKHPHQVLELTSLPRTALGKVQRAELVRALHLVG